MKGVIDILYKWCGALHRGTVRTFTDGFYRWSQQAYFIGGSIKIEITRRATGEKQYVEAEYSGSGTDYITWELQLPFKEVTKVEATNCRYLKVRDDVLIPMH